jgi:hypothetical protein
MTENQQLFDSLLSDYQVRKSKKQKLRFIAFVQERCLEAGWDCRVEEKKGIVTTRNIVVGDISKANVICTAHYDTCAWAPFPNFIAPRNIFSFILSQFLIVGILFAASYAVAFLANLFISGAFISLIFRLIFLALCLQITFGYPNKHTANDNTSGVATLLALMQSIHTTERDKVAFVFFDYEEIGLVGSSVFKKKYKSVISDKLLINFDCVSDGDHFLFVSKKMASTADEFPLLKRILEEEAPVAGKQVVFTSALRSIFPSDQILFHKSIGICCLKKAPFIGLYQNRIHTAKDTRFDRNNLAFLTRAFTKFISQV